LDFAIAIGSGAGSTSQSSNAIAIGSNAGCNTQLSNAISIGNNAGNNSQQPNAVAIGPSAGNTNQRGNCVAIGNNAGGLSQQDNAISIGTNAGCNTQGTNAIAIGNRAGILSQHNNSIILRPVTNPGSNVLWYDNTTNEISYDTAKTFVINHPVDPARYLVHGCLEGPEAGVYYRGKGEIIGSSVEIELPHYVAAFSTDFTVQVTPIYNGKVRTLNVSEVENGVFTVYGEPGAFNWLVHGIRGTVNVEPLKSEVDVKGSGPYRWI
jgi:hypothetical protein